MCGRFVVARPASELVSVLRVDVEGDALPPPSFNIAPTTMAAIVVESQRTDPLTRRLETARWGLVPSWAKDLSIGKRAFNARSETIGVKPMFRDALAKRRAIVPASGYYEWKSTSTAKVPYFISSQYGTPMFFAGLYEWWRDPTEDPGSTVRWNLSFTIITRSAVAHLVDIHDRMPVVVDADLAHAWLNPTTVDVGGALRTAMTVTGDVASTLTVTEVSRAVGNVRNNGPEIIKPVVSDSRSVCSAEAHESTAGHVPCARDSVRRQQVP